MKTRCRWAGLILLILVAVLPLAPTVASAKRLGNRTYELAGIIKNVDEQFKTAVVECRRKGQTVTVGGPVSSQAVLEKEGIGVGLGDFYVGEKVVVRWRVTPKTHVILMLRGKHL